ncbi:MAG: SPFH domain-containing protein [Firmicutes bacterium]|nr:SPFH domain-containing protein [Bacillota bacterium]
MAFRNVITTLTDNGEEIMGADVLLYHYPRNDILTGSLLTVESNQFCVLKSRGALLNVFETGQYTVETPQKVLLGAITQAFYGGTSPWQYEAIYLNRAKLVIHAEGQSRSAEMASLQYHVDYYIHVDSTDDALKLVQHMPYSGHFVRSEHVNAYALPIIEQAINQICQVTPLIEINAHIHDITDLLTAHLQDFLAVYGITVNSVKAVVFPNDPLLDRLISLRAFGLSPDQAVRTFIALQMAERGVITIPNVLNNTSFTIQGGITDLSSLLHPGPPPGEE